MKGKVFPESSGLAEDKALVLFEYFKGAAKRIVAEEMALENRIDEQKREIEKAKVEYHRTFVRYLITAIAGLVVLVIIGILTGTVILAAVGVLIALVFFALILVAKRKAKQAVELAETKIHTFEEEHRNIRRDYKVHKLGTVLVPVATRVPFKGRSFLVDHTGRVPPQNFRLSEIRDIEELKGAVEAMDRLLETIPVVDGGEETETVDSTSRSRSIGKFTMHEWSASLDRQLRKINFVFQDLKETSIDIPIIEPDSEYAKFLEEYGADEETGSLKLKVFQTDDLEPAVKSFQKLADLSDEKTTGSRRSIEDYCRNIMKRSSDILQLLSETRAKSLETMNLITEGFFSTIAKASYNYYSPAKEAENIERIRQETFDLDHAGGEYENLQLKKSSLMSYDPISDNWVAEDGTRSSVPFGMHQVFEEIFVPMVTTLMQENRIERLKIYNAIKDQKIEYLNQWHRDTEDFYARNRSEINEILNRIRSVSAEYMSDLNTFKAHAETLSNMRSGQAVADKNVDLSAGKEEIAVFEAQALVAQNFLAQFEETLDSVKEEINTLTQDFEHIEYFEASLRDGEAREYAQAMQPKDYDGRRKRLASMGPQIAASAVLPPSPEVGDDVSRDFMINLNAVYENAVQEIRTRENELAEAKASKQESGATEGDRLGEQSSQAGEA